MITLTELKVWLEKELKQFVQEEKIKYRSKGRAYLAAIAITERQTNAQEVVNCIRAWARGLMKVAENEQAIRASEDIAEYIEATYTWDLYTYGAGVKATHRVEGPFFKHQEAIERAIDLWRETGAYHTPILIGGMEEQRLQKPPAIRYYQVFQDDEKTVKVDGHLAFVLEDGQAYYQGPKVHRVYTLEVLLTFCKEISEEEVGKEAPELVTFARKLNALEFHTPPGPPFC